MEVEAAEDSGQLPLSSLNAKVHLAEDRLTGSPNQKMHRRRSGAATAGADGDATADGADRNVLPHGQRPSTHCCGRCCCCGRRFCWCLLVLTALPAYWAVMPLWGERAFRQSSRMRAQLLREYTARANSSAGKQVALQHDLLSTDPPIWRVDNFLSEAECDYLMEVAKPHPSHCVTLLEVAHRAPQTSYLCYRRTLVCSPRAFRGFPSRWYRSWARGHRGAPHAFVWSTTMKSIQQTRGMRC